jgi:mono/diheme cytochrome c family protein
MIESEGRMSTAGRKMPMTVARRGATLTLLSVLALTAGCGGNQETVGSEPTPTQTTTGAATVAGDAAHGKEVFVAQHCGGCHTLGAAGTSGTVGPNLDQQLIMSARKAGEPLSDFARESIVNPNAFLAEGYNGAIMPTSFGDQLSDQEIADLVAFVVQSVQS